jgi:hypothetical protein
MTIIDDGYDSFYAERLWLLLPGVYRADDSPNPSASGPLRELVNRIGAQMALVRRSIDRLWADQSIETCDDWVIPYIGDLLGVNLVNPLDTRAQRLDVAKTIHYRRRKGTVQVLQELATDVTDGWSAVIVEAFRRIARTRHGLDPALGPAAFPSIPVDTFATFLSAEGLCGALTGTPAGGTLDLRVAHGAQLTGTAFDESFHYVDVRAGVGQVGHFTIPKLLVFLWRLKSFKVAAGTPVQLTSCPEPTFTFDPTGRLAPIFLPQPANSNSQGVADESDFVEGGVDVWLPPNEIQVPGPLSRSLLKSYPDGPQEYEWYAATLGNQAAIISSVTPELGQFTLATAGSVPTVQYWYGFPSDIGAGTYTHQSLSPSVTADLVAVPTVRGGGEALDVALSAAPLSAVVTIDDCLTYTKVSAVGSDSAPIKNLVISAGVETRPVIRPPASETPWVFTGSGPPLSPPSQSGSPPSQSGAPAEATLILDGLLITGTDIVLRGAFAEVTINNCTFDPGATAEPPAPLGESPLASAADGRPLSPATIFIEAGAGGAVAQLTVTNSILGPVRTRFGGAVESLTISNSILQAVPTTNVPTYSASDIYDPVLLADGLTSQDPLAQALLSKMAPSEPSLKSDLSALASTNLDNPSRTVPASLTGGLNFLVKDATLIDTSTLPLFETAVTLGPTTSSLFAQAAKDVSSSNPSSLSSAQQQALNRALIDATFPVALGLEALAVSSASVSLTDVTVLGPLYAHDLSLSDSIVTGLITTDDSQTGCVRFSAFVRGSLVPRQYESLFISEEAAIFTSTQFGQPGYCQLLDSADDAVASGSSATSILTGADTGSEMGVFSADLNPLKERALLIKYDEYMPLGLAPVLVHVT